MSFRKQTRYPTYDTQEIKGEANQVTVANGVEKRLKLVVTKLPKWGPKGVTVEILRNTLNRLVNVNFAETHIQYALEWLYKNNVIGKRSDGDTASYYAFATTTNRFKAALVSHHKK